MLVELRSSRQSVLTIAAEAENDIDLGEDDGEDEDMQSAAEKLLRRHNVQCPSPYWVGTSKLWENAGKNYLIKYGEGDSVASLL